MTPQLTDYLANTTPWTKQQEAFAAALDETNNPYFPLFAEFMEQRTGKSIVTIGLATYWYERGEIDALLIVAAPAGVPSNWRDEIEGTPNNDPPRRMPDRIKRQTLVWDCSKASTKAFQKSAAELMTFTGQLSILLVPSEAVSTDAWRAYAARFVRKRKVLAVVDESSLVMARAKNKRAKILRGLSHHTRYRYILDGTPAGESPLAMYPQMAFLDTRILGADNSTLFKAKYADITKKLNHNTGREYPVLNGYKNLDEMAARLTPVSFRCTRKECYDIPDKQYLPYRFDLSPEQRRVYDQLEDRYEAELRCGTLVSARLVLTRYLRFQQIASNYWPAEVELILCPECNGSGCQNCDDLGGVPNKTPPRIIDPKHDPRLEAYRDVLELNPTPLITWARFTADIDKTIKAAKEMGRKPVRYDGQVTKDQKYTNLRAFQGGEADVIVAQQPSMQRGVNAGAAKAHVFYSNMFSGILRQQSEDRTEVSGRTEGTAIIDLIARDTKDEDIVLAHVEKLSLSEMVMRR